LRTTGSSLLNLSIALYAPIDLNGQVSGRGTVIDVDHGIPVEQKLNIARREAELLKLT